MTTNVNTSVDTTRVSSLEQENSTLKTKIQSLQSENQSLETQLSTAQQEAAKVELSQSAQQKNTEIKKDEVSQETQQFLNRNKIDMATESKTFDKQNVLAQAGSFIASQSNALTSNAIKLLS